MRHYTMKENLISAAIGVALGLIFGLCHWKSVMGRTPQLYQVEPVKYKTLQYVAVEDPEPMPAPLPVTVETTDEPSWFIDPDIPMEVQEAAQKYGELYGLSPEFLEAVAYAESRYDPEAVNGGCLGLMQISTRWHIDRMERLGVTDIFDLDGNMAVGADYLAELFATYEDAGAVLMYYNGDANAEAYLNGSARLSGYASGILAMAEELEEKHGK